MVLRFPLRLVALRNPQQIMVKQHPTYTIANFFGLLGDEIFAIRSPGWNGNEITADAASDGPETVAIRTFSGQEAEHQSPGPDDLTN